MLANEGPASLSAIARQTRIAPNFTNWLPSRYADLREVERSFASLAFASVARRLAATFLKNSIDHHRMNGAAPDIYVAGRHSAFQEGASIRGRRTMSGLSAVAAAPIGSRLKAEIVVIRIILQTSRRFFQTG
jgi:hypothetical protein